MTTVMKRPSRKRKAKRPKRTNPRAFAIVTKYVPKVETIRDADDAIDIEVTPSDASSKAVKDHGACAMAVACKRKLKLDAVIISRSIAYLVRGTVATRYTVPENITREVVAFDRGGAFAPGTYTLLPPIPAIRLDSPKHKQGGSTHTVSGKHSARHLTANIRTALKPGHRNGD